MLSILIVITLFHLLFPDYVQFGSTLQWDGEKYIEFALHFPQAAFGQTLNIYYFQRIFPSGIIYLAAQLTKTPLTAQHVFYAFLGLNILCIFLSFAIWLLICKELGLSNKGKLLGFTGLFVNFAMLKMAFYYPALTDVMAFTLGMVLLYFFLKNNNAGVLITGFVGAFTFPTVFYAALLLFVFPREQARFTPSGKYTSWNDGLVILSVLGYSLLVVLFCFYRKVPLINPAPPLVLALSIVAALAYLFVAGKIFYKTKFYLHSIRNFNGWNRGWIAISIWGAVYTILLWGAGNEPSPLNYKGFLANIVVSSLANPLAFLVSHVVYVGPVFLLALYFARQFAVEVNRQGLGLHLLVLGYVLLSINSETRISINAWPFFVFFLCTVLEKTKLPASFYVLLLLFALAMSKFWYRIDVNSFSENYLEFPEQKYFMSIGPWMSDGMYLLQGSIVLLVAFWMYWFYFRRIQAG